MDMLQPCKKKNGGHSLKVVAKEFVNAETGETLVLSKKDAMQMIVKAFWQAKKPFDSVKDVENPILSEREINNLYDAWIA